MGGNLLWVVLGRWALHSVVTLRNRMGEGSLREVDTCIYRWLKPLIMYRCSLVMFLCTGWLLPWASPIGSNSSESVSMQTGGDLGWVLARKILWEVKHNPFQYSYLENPMDRGSLQATNHERSYIFTHFKDLNHHHSRNQIFTPLQL